MNSFFRRMRASSELQKDIQNARHAAINWRVDVLPRLRRQASLYLWSEGIYASEVPREDGVFQLNLHRGRACLAQQENSTSKSSPTAKIESPAVLVVSLAQNGLIAAHISGHESDIVETESKQLVIDVHYGTDRLCGRAGDSRIVSWLRDVERLSILTTFEKVPSRWAGKQLEILVRRAEKFQFLHADRSEARKNRATIEIVLTAGIAASLLGSSLVPLVVSYLGAAPRSGQIVAVVGLAVALLILIAGLHLRSLANSR